MFWILFSWAELTPEFDICTPVNTRDISDEPQLSLIGGVPIISLLVELL